MLPWRCNVAQTWLEKLPIFSHENPNLVGRSVSQCILWALHCGVTQLEGIEAENKSIESVKEKKCEHFFENLHVSLLKDVKTHTLHQKGIFNRDVTITKSRGTIISWFKAAVQYFLQYFQ